MVESSVGLTTGAFCRDCACAGQQNRSLAHLSEPTTHTLRADRTEGTGNNFTSDRPTIFQVHSDNGHSDNGQPTIIEDKCCVLPGCGEGKDTTVESVNHHGISVAG